MPVLSTQPALSGCRILGIDPGSQRTGVGIIDVDALGKLTHVFHGALAVAGEDTFPLRLKRIFDELTDIITMHRPVECGIEGRRAARRFARWSARA